MFYLIAAIAAYFALVLVSWRYAALNRRREAQENEELRRECEEVLERWEK